MKLFVAIWISFVPFISWAQKADHFTETINRRERELRMEQMRYVPNEVLVKFRDEVKVNSGRLLKSAGINGVDRLLQRHGAEGLEKLFPTETRLKAATVVKDPLGRDMVIPSLHNLFKIVLPELKSTGHSPVDIMDMIQELNSMPEVDYAEPNYLFSVGDFKAAGPEMSLLEAKEVSARDELLESTSSLVPNDPLYDAQWGIPATKIDMVWNTTTGDDSQVIAIIDTGVDWGHPDLSDNVWANQQEVPDNGMDDDGNGYIDDIRGWDFINSDNNPMDDNSHGTHVAGIAAAVGNNGIGIAGVNWKAKIMPLKVFQSSGNGDVATIAQGINYSVNQGATVLNMSFGSYVESLTLKNVLANAYASAVLVAAAGNDAKPIGPINGLPVYPGAYSFVLGVEANTVTGRAGFSNFDQDGPVFSQFSDLLNYELKAPGSGIISCVPGGNYREYNGTSMATPLVAGAVSLYLQLKPDDSPEVLFGNFIHSIDQHIDLFNALNIDPEPDLDIVSCQIEDLVQGDGDGHPDAGEPIEIYIKVRNTWGEADDVKVGVELGEFEDATVAQVLNSEAGLGNISAYATRQNEMPLKVQIASDVAHNRDIRFNLKTWYGDHEGLVSQPLVLKVQNGVELAGIILKDSVLSAGRYWIINKSLRITDTVTVTIMPGAYIEVNNPVDLRGKIIAVGTPDSLIRMKGAINGDAVYKYCEVDLKGTSLSSLHNIENCIISNGGNIISEGAVRNCYIKSIRSQFGFSGDFIDCYFSDIYFTKYNSHTCLNCVYDDYKFNGGPVAKHTVFNKIINYILFNNPGDYAAASYNPAILFQGINDWDLSLIAENSYIYDQPYTYVCSTSSVTDMVHFPNQYWGTTNRDEIKTKYLDFWNDSWNALLDTEPILNQPSDSCHAHVWKVLVNGKDAQDEVVDPAGVGKQRFDVYFNRPMNKSNPPEISFGVRYPYNQQVVNEEGSWSEDGRVYTAYKTVGLTTGDGINRVRVSGAKEADGWDWEIPVEDQRFEFVISAASSASNEFMATPGLGKVALEWNNHDLEDGLGYNMYRMEQINDTTLSKPVMINSSLITDTLFTDYAVVPSQKYFYYYRILRTNLEETDSSKVVAAIPLTASKGDANGDLTVNVLDVTTIVAHLLGNNPQPFIFEAADVNGDQVINVLDIVGVVNLVLNPGKSATIVSGATVNLYVQNDTLFADAPVAIGAIQLEIAGASSIEEIEKMAALQGFESGYSIQDRQLRLIVYSLSGKTIPAGNRIPLLRLKKGSGITGVVLGDKTGAALSVSFLSTGVWSLRELGPEVATLGQNYPNPLDQTTTIPVMVNEPVDEILIRIIGFNGQEIALLPVKKPVIGENLIHWTPGAHKGLMAYILEVRRNGQQSIAGVKKMVVR